MIDGDKMEERFSKLASIIGEKGRAKMLWHLLDGRAYTALELAIIADISKQSCSNSRESFLWFLEITSKPEKIIQLTRL